MPFSDFFLKQKLLAQGVNPVSGAGGPSTPGGAPANPGLFQGLLGAAFPVSDASGLTTPEQQRAAQQQGLLGFGTSLLANSGPQPGPRQGFGSLVGQALQAGQGAATGGINQQIQQMLLSAKINEAKNGAQGQDPALVAEYKFAKENGYTGSFQEYAATKQNQGQGGIGNFNPGDYTPESLQAYLTSRTPQNQLGDPSLLKRYSAPVTAIRNVENVPTAINVDRTGGGITQTPLSTLPATANAARTVKAAEAEGAATGGATGDARGAILKRGIAGAQVQDLLSIAEPLIELSTGSGAGAATDSFLSFFGFAPDGALAAAQLKPLEAALISAQPRLEGPQGVLDLKLYKEAAANIGDPSVPAAAKKAALQTIRQIQQKAQQAAGQQQGPPSLSGATPTNRPPLSSFRR